MSFPRSMKQPQTETIEVKKVSPDPTKTKPTQVTEPNKATENKSPND